MSQETSPDSASAATTRSGPPLPLFGLLVAAGILGSLYLIFFHAQAEALMGEVYRIFYFHVSSAMGALLLFFGASLLSIGYLAMSAMSGMQGLARRADRLAWSMAEIGVVFGVVVLVTGPLWAKPAWGTFWTWEPRLTLTLLIVFLFIGYLVLRAYGGADEMGRKISAGIAVIGGPAAYLVHIAVELWQGGNHPQVVTGKGQGLATPEMQLTFSISIACVFVLIAYLVHARYRAHALQDRVEDLFLDLADLEANP